MTPNKAIEHVDNIKPNAYREEDKFQWLCNLDGMVKQLVFQETEPVMYEYPKDMDTELLIPAPWEEVYALYMEAMIDYHNREYNYYNNSLQMFYTRFAEYRKAYIRENMPEGAGTFKL